MKKFFKIIDYRFFIAFAITLIFVIITGIFFQNSVIRFIEAVRDVIFSIIYYFSELLNLNLGIAPAVNNFSLIPLNPIFHLPANWDEFVVIWNDFWSVFFNGKNFSEYLTSVGDFLYIFFQIVLLAVVPSFLLLWLIVSRYVKKENNKYNYTSRPLRLYKKIALKFAGFKNCFHIIFLFRYLESLLLRGNRPCRVLLWF